MQRVVRDQADPHEPEESSEWGRGAEALLTLDHGEEQGREWYECEQRLAEPGMHLDECVIVEAERAAELDQAVEQQTGQCPSARERQLQRRHESHEQNCRE